MDNPENLAPNDTKDEEKQNKQTSIGNHHTQNKHK